MPNTLPKLILTSGEPAGIGPDLVLAAAGDHWDAQLVAVGNEALLAERADMLGLSIELLPYNSTDAPQRHQAGRLPLIDIPLHAACTPGTPDIRNASARRVLNPSRSLDGAGSLFSTPPSQP